MATAAAINFLGAGCSPSVSVEKTLAAYQEQGAYQALTIRYPQNQTVFPPEIVPCTFEWQESSTPSDTWLILFEFAGVTGRRAFLSHEPKWTPAREDWEKIKQQSREQPARVTVLGFQRATPAAILSRGQISISTSKDPVGAPLFYREVNLPFREAVKDPTRIRWRFGTIDSVQPPPVVLEHLPVCGNCHSFSQDGRMLGMDVDYANNKGSYVLTPVAKEMTLASSDILTWSDFQRAPGEETFGFLSQVSPDGQAAISTVKDKSVFVAKPELAFSQLFFPIQGILAVYRKNTRTFAALPGADDPEYVQSNPTWSPDGQYIV
ncbi:MAG TPA: hypothetical protein VNT26_04045, partial [Candidatus Sulfotelmatobacter sp.]|nr:hypothetical protein [Candidatus Sulfotelmatobacter sp.]